MRISDWSSDVCSSDLERIHPPRIEIILVDIEPGATVAVADHARLARLRRRGPAQPGPAVGDVHAGGAVMFLRSEEHTSELQSLMRISYAVFCLKKKKKNKN